jgi:hypothetical protein
MHRKAILLGHIIRTHEASKESTDPMFNVTFATNTYKVRNRTFKRVGRPRLKWAVETLRYTYEKMFPNQKYTQTIAQNEQIIQQAIAGTPPMEMKRKKQTVKIHAFLNVREYTVSSDSDMEKTDAAVRKNLAKRKRHTIKMQTRRAEARESFVFNTDPHPNPHTSSVASPVILPTPITNSASTEIAGNHIEYSLTQDLENLIDTTEPPTDAHSNIEQQTRETRELSLEEICSKSWTLT